MDSAKLLMILCCFILIVCLTLCISTLTVLRNAVDEHDTIQNTARDLVNQLDVCIDVMKEMNNEENSLQTSTGNNQETGFNLCIREENGTIGIFDSDGTLLKRLDISPESLPQSDRELLKKGISVSSWQELISLLQDYTA